jgi:hypothetical protein
MINMKNLSFFLLLLVSISLFECLQVSNKQTNLTPATTTKTTTTTGDKITTITKTTSTDNGITSTNTITKTTSAPSAEPPKVDEDEENEKKALEAAKKAAAAKRAANLEKATAAAATPATQNGPSGGSGQTGPSGGSGQTGPSGASGQTGPSGGSGQTGPSGGSGKNELSGASGKNELSGASGSTGATEQKRPSAKPASTKIATDSTETKETEEERHKKCGEIMEVLEAMFDITKQVKLLIHEFKLHIKLYQKWQKETKTLQEKLALEKKEEHIITTYIEKLVTMQTIFKRMKRIGNGLHDSKCTAKEEENNNKTRLSGAEEAVTTLIELLTNRMKEIHMTTTNTNFIEFTNQILIQKSVKLSNKMKMKKAILI